MTANRRRAVPGRVAPAIAVEKARNIDEYLAAQPERARRDGSAAVRKKIDLAELVFRLS